MSAHPSSAMTAGTHTALLSELSSHLSSRIAEKQADLVRPAFGFSSAKVLAAIILLPFTGWLASTSIESFKTSRVRSVAQRVIETSTEVKGYPLAVDVEPWGRALTITGTHHRRGTRGRGEAAHRLAAQYAGARPTQRRAFRRRCASTACAGARRTRAAAGRYGACEPEADGQPAAGLRRRGRAGPSASAADAAAAKVVERAEETATQTIAELRALQQKLGALQGRHADLAPVKDQLAELSRSLTVANGDIAGTASLAQTTALRHALDSNAARQ